MDIKHLHSFIVINLKICFKCLSLFAHRFNSVNVAVCFLKGDGATLEPDEYEGWFFAVFLITCNQALALTCYSTVSTHWCLCVLSL